LQSYIYTIENINTLQHKGIAGIAVVSAIMKANNPSLVAQKFLEKLKQ